MQMYRNDSIMNCTRFIHLCLISLYLLLAACSSSDSSAPLTSEAGYIEIEPISFSLQQQGLDTYNDTSSTARILYSFHPANQDPAGKPLFVFLNGGPGCATTTNLFSMNTAPYTLDKLRTNGNPYAANPYSWTALGNLLYIDAPNTGFSYNVVSGASDLNVRFSEFNSKNFNPFIDSANVIRALLRFLDTHPAIRANQVVLVGESYSGTRVSTMLNLLLFYRKYGTGEKIYKDTALVAEIERHLARVFPAEAATGSLTPATVARQFGRQILIQPEISGPYQAEADGDLFEQKGSVIDQLAAVTGKVYTRCDPADTTCGKEMNALTFVEKSAGRDRYNMTMQVGWTDELEAFAMQGLLDVDILSRLFGYDVRNISMLRPEARKDAYRYVVNKNEDPDGWGLSAGSLSQKLLLERDSLARMNALLGSSGGNSLENIFGSLPVYDGYLSGTNLAVFVAFISNSAIYARYPISPDESPIFGQMFLENAPLIKTFLTDAEYDLVIYSPGYPEALKKYTGIVKSVDVKRGKELRQATGSFRINYQTGSLGSIDTPLYVDIFYPYYSDSGHSISSAQPDKLLSDVAGWLKSTTR